MKKTLNINLGGIPLIIDEDAYDRLDQYLLQLQKHFRNSEGRDEILSDIEARLAELLVQSRKDRTIVNMDDVMVSMGIMGTPEEFQADFADDQKGRPDAGFDIRTGKKLFRDPNEKVIGGVCSGLSAYFGIEDPIWVRLAFAIVFFTLGFGLLAYLILWAIVPEAKTAGDRLAMMGEPANVKNIARMVESGIDELSEAIKDIGQEFKKKRTGRKRGRTGDYAGGSGEERFLTLKDPSERSSFL